MRVGLEVIGTGDGTHEIEQTPHDAIFIEARHLGKRIDDGARDLAGDRLARLLVERRALLVGEPHIEAMIEQLDDLTRDGAIADKGGSNIIGGIGNARLAQVARQASQQRHIAPIETFFQHQGVETVVLGVPGPHCQEALFQFVALGRYVEGAAVGGGQHHLVDEDASAIAVDERRDGKGVLLDGLQAHVFENGQTA